MQRDVQMQKVAELMGDTVNEVYRTYSHLSPKDLAGAVKILNDIATGKGE